MKSEIAKSKNGIEIDVTDVKGHEVELLKAFQECQEGRCSCPTQEYKKIDSIDIKQSEGSIHLTIIAKNGNAMDGSEIDKCLEYTARKISVE